MVTREFELFERERIKTDQHLRGYLQKRIEEEKFLHEEIEQRCEHRFGARLGSLEQAKERLERENADLQERLELQEPIPEEESPGGAPSTTSKGRNGAYTEMLERIGLRDEEHHPAAGTKEERMNKLRKEFEKELEQKLATQKSELEKAFSTKMANVRQELARGRAEGEWQLEKEYEEKLVEETERWETEMQSFANETLVLLDGQRMYVEDVGRVLRTRCCWTGKGCMWKM